MPKACATHDTKQIRSKGALRKRKEKNKEEKSAKDIRITRGHSSVWWMQWKSDNLTW